MGAPGTILLAVFGFVLLVIVVAFFAAVAVVAKVNRFGEPGGVG
jgi:hypothetical protein